MGTRAKKKPTQVTAVADFSNPFESGVLFDERLLSREQALLRYFSPRDTSPRIRPTQERLLSDRDGTFAWLNPRSSFVAPQIRELYDPTRIDRMGVNIAEGQDGQLQNGGVSFIDDEHIERYLRDMNEYFETQVEPPDLTRHAKFGCYIITAYGHNRQLAIASANQRMNGHPDKGLRFFVKVFQNPEFWRILGNQATENTGEAPPMWVRARSIVKYQQFRNRDGIRVTKEDVGKLFNVDKDQIWRAERYDALPQPIKDLVMAERLPYSGAFELDQLVGVYDEEYIVSLAQRLAKNDAMRPQILDAVRRRLTASVLTPEIRHIIDNEQITLHQAEELAKLKDFMSPEGLNEFAVWICTRCPDIVEIRRRVKSIIKDKMDGAMYLLDDHTTAVDDPERLQAVMAEYRKAELVAGAQVAMTEVTKMLRGIQSIYTSGLMGDHADNKPVANSAPDHLHALLASLLSLIDETEPNDQLSIVVERVRILIGEESQTESFASDLEEVLAGLNELLILEAGETAQTQAERRRAMGGGLLQMVRKPEVATQEGLF